MSNAQHTPGPWFTFANGACVGGPAGHLGNPSGADTAGIAHCGMALRTHSEVQANAALIAAAPELLEALKACAAVCAGETVNKNGLINALTLARDALAKAGSAT